MKKMKQLQMFQKEYNPADSMDETESQTRQIYRHLVNGLRLTPRDARVLYNCDRLGARIYNIRNGQRGVPRTAVRTELITEGKKRFAEYRIDKTT